MTQNFPSVGIIGAGFSGSLLAVHLLRRLPQGARVHLIERRSEFGSGLAYSTANASHLLNVRAERMSAFEDDPEHFLRWLATQPDITPRAGTAFVPRGLYGRYVQSLLAEQLWTEGGNRNLYLFPDEASSLDFSDDSVTIRMSGGRPVRVDVAVLAVGNFPPQVPSGAESLVDSPRYQANPWDVAATAAIRSKASVLVIGTGLTMVDFVLNLLDRGHRGPILALSRRGLLPHRHEQGPPPREWIAEDEPVSLSTRLRQIRRATKQQDWRSVFDGLRPHTRSWWNDLSLAERQRFLRHARPWWDIHRHRMAPDVAERISAAIQQGALSLVAGKFAQIDEDDDRVRITFRPRGRDRLGQVVVDHVVNCSGPSSDYARIEQPFLRDLLARGEIIPDALSLGLAVDPMLRLLKSDGQPQARLYGMGPVTRGRFWECTAVPEIRRQAEELAAQITETWATTWATHWAEGFG
jgi:uncharacterized NAD(P)/FAD-binding protein YdhS